MNGPATKPGADLLAIIAEEFDEGDVIRLFTAGSHVDVALRNVDQGRGLLFGRAWPDDNALAYRASCIHGFIDLNPDPDEDDE
jgi:hypothetical protein